MMHTGRRVVEEALDTKLTMQLGVVRLYTTSAQCTRWSPLFKRVNGHPPRIKSFH